MRAVCLHQALKKKSTFDMVLSEPVGRCFAFDSIRTTDRSIDFYVASMKSVSPSQ